MKRMHYAWWVCIGCAVILFCTSGLSVNAFTVYQPYIMRFNGYTNAQSSLLITVRSLCGFASMLASGLYYKKVSLRLGMALSCAVNGLGFLVYSLAKSYLTYCCAAALIGLGYGTGTMIPVVILLGRWFEKKRTLAIGACAAVTGFSSMGVPTIITAVIERWGMRVCFLGEGVFVVAMALAAFCLLRSDPADMGLQPYGVGEGEKAAARKAGPGVEKKDWPLLIPALLMMGGVTGTGYSHLTVHASALGYTPHTVALCLTVSGTALMIGKVGYGWVAERIGSRNTNWVFGALLVAGCAMLCLMRGGSPVLLFSAMAINGVGLGFTTVGNAAWAGAWSGPGQYDNTVRRFQIGYSGGQLVFSSLPGIMADHAGGSYRGAYIVFLACSVFVLAAVQYLYYKKRVK